MQPSSHQFKSQSVGALHDQTLQQALTRVQDGFINKRADAVAKVAEFEHLREQGRDIKQHTLEHLDYYLEQYEAAVEKAGGQVHWAKDSAEACRIILDLCRQAEAKSVRS